MAYYDLPSFTWITCRKIIPIIFSIQLTANLLAYFHVNLYKYSISMVNTTEYFRTSNNSRLFVEKRGVTLLDISSSDASQKNTVLVDKDSVGVVINNLKLPECVVDYRCRKEDVKSPKLQFNFTRVNESFEYVAKQHQDVKLGGSWNPTNCRPKEITAIIIPYRNRENNLQIFIQNIIPFLKIQKKAFTLFVVEQVGPNVFNKAHIMNAGFIESQKLGNYSCFIFHDVDMVPVHLCNLYQCEQKGARHLGLSRNLTRPRYVYLPCMGGASAYTKTIFEKVNGHTTVMFGWGGEDDDAYIRLRSSRIPVYTRPAFVGNYYQARHGTPRSTFPNSHRGMWALRHHKYMKYDGLNTLNYTVHKIQKQALFTRIQVSVPGPELGKEIMPYFHLKRKEFQLKYEKDHEKDQVNTTSHVKSKLSKKIKQNSSKVEIKKTSELNHKKGKEFDVKV